MEILEDVVDRHGDHGAEAGDDQPPRDRIVTQGEKLTTKSLDALVKGDLNYKLVRRRRSEA